MSTTAHKLATTIEHWAETVPDGIAVLDARGAWTWREVHELAMRMSSAFERARTDVLFLPAGGAALALLAASERAGGRGILVAPPYGEARAREVGQIFGARRVVTVSGPHVDVLSVAEPVVEASVDDSDRVTSAVLVLTSGTTAAPRCAVHTWSTLASAVNHGAAHTGQRWFAAYPLSHFAGLQVLAQAVFTGGTLVVPGDFSAPTGLSLLRDHRVTHLCATPTYVRQLLMGSTVDDWGGFALTHVTLGGEVVDQPLLDRLRELRPSIAITHTYASTELGAILSVRDGREGFDAGLLASRQLEIREGELFVRRSGRSMLGYVTDRTTDPTDWVATGDLVEVVDGRVLFRGRTTDVINVGGFKVHPTDVERVIREVPGVRDVCVMGRKSSIMGNLVTAVVQPDALVDHATLKSAIVAHCSTRLASHMVPRMIELRDELPRGVTGKVLRRR